MKDGYMKYGMDGYKQGDMKPKVENCQTPSGAFSEKYNQSPLMYKERQDSKMVKAGSKLKGEAYKGRYGY